MNYLTFTSNYSSEVEIAVDDLFESILPLLTFGESEFDAIKAIDRAEPIVGITSVLPIFSSDLNPTIAPSELSSDTKSIILIMHRVKHPELKWIPSMNSMDPIAKNYTLKYLLDLVATGTCISFPLYCTVNDFSQEYADLPCLNTRGELKTLSEIIEE